MAEPSASDQIDAIIEQHKGWKGETLTRLRLIIKQADANIVEEVKWKMANRPEGLPVWSDDGIVCFAETWKDNIKLLFPKGAHLKDPQNLFNARLLSKTTRAIELHEGDDIDATWLKALVSAAAELNNTR